MNAPLESSWLEQNQGALAAAIARLRERLTRFAAEGVAANADDDAPAAPTLAGLCEAFGLSPFERDVLLLAAGRELSGELAATLAESNGGRPYATFSLALAALPGAHWSALSPGAPLRAWRLVEAIGEAGLTQRELRVDEPILHWLTGVAAPDERLAGLIAPMRTAVGLAPSHDAVAQRIARAVRSAAGQGLPWIELVGADHDTRVGVAAAAASALDQPMVRITAAGLSLAPHERHELAVRVKRASVLMGTAILVCAENKDAEPLLESLTDAPGPLFVAWGDPAVPMRAGAWRFIVEAAPEAEQRALVAAALEGAGDGPRVETLAPRVVDHLARALRSTAGPLPGEAVLDACRRDTRAQLEPLAQRIESRAGWDDLVVPAETPAPAAAIAEPSASSREGLRGLGLRGEERARPRHQRAVRRRRAAPARPWPPRCSPASSRLDLYHIDLSSVVSKYIGETEKNLRAPLRRGRGRAARSCSSTRPTRCSASAPRCATATTATPTSRSATCCSAWRRYRGLAILTTNLKSALDTAFLRRIRFVVHFPFPDAAQPRRDLAARASRAATPTDELEPERLAQLNVAGGHIRNIALTAAFLAAARDEAVTMQHVLEGVRLEYGKLEKPLADAETRGWAGGRR